RRLARKCYLLWREDPRYPSLHFKKVGPRVWSARISDDFRAVATAIEGGFLYLIGSHDEYEELIKRLSSKYYSVRIGQSCAGVPAGRQNRGGRSPVARFARATSELRRWVDRPSRNSSLE